MAGSFTKRIWQPCICQPNELKRDIKKKTGWAKQKSGGPWPTQAPLKSPLPISLPGTAYNSPARGGLCWAVAGTRAALHTGAGRVRVELGAG